jgi:hypothetical protein
MSNFVRALRRDAPLGWKNRLGAADEIVRLRAELAAEPEWEPYAEANAANKRLAAALQLAERRADIAQGDVAKLREALVMARLALAGDFEAATLGAAIADIDAVLAETKGGGDE